MIRLLKRLFRRAFFIRWDNLPRPDRDSTLWRRSFGPRQRDLW
jgi:hypothetical protein